MKNIREMSKAELLEWFQKHKTELRPEYRNEEFKRVWRCLSEGLDEVLSDESLCLREMAEQLGLSYEMAALLRHSLISVGLATRRSDKDTSLCAMHAPSKEVVWANDQYVGVTKFETDILVHGGSYCLRVHTRVLSQQKIQRGHPAVFGISKQEDEQYEIFIGSACHSKSGPYIPKRIVGTLGLKAGDAVYAIVSKDEALLSEFY